LWQDIIKDNGQGGFEVLSHFSPGLVGRVENGGQQLQSGAGRRPGDEVLNGLNTIEAAILILANWPFTLSLLKGERDSTVR